MTTTSHTPKDIIGIVKELQATYEALYPLRELSEEEKRINSQWHSDVCINFYAIAQALLIAVEALEKARRCVEPYAEPGIPTVENALLREVFLDSNEALARIRSLS